MQVDHWRFVERRGAKDNPMCSSRYWVRARALAKLGKGDEAIAAATEALRRAEANESPVEAREIRAWIDARRRVKPDILR